MIGKRTAPMATDTKPIDDIITLDDIRAMTKEQLLVMFPSIPELFTYHPELDKTRKAAPEDSKDKDND